MTLLIIIQIIIAFVLVIFVLLQHSDNEGLGLGGGSSLGGLMSARGSANFLSRATSVLPVILIIRVSRASLIPASIEALSEPSILTIMS